MRLSPLRKRRGSTPDLHQVHQIHPVMLTRIIPGYSKHLMRAQLKFVASRSWIEQILLENEEFRNGDDPLVKEIVVLQDLV